VTGQPVLAAVKGRGKFAVPPPVICTVPRVYRSIEFIESIMVKALHGGRIVLTALLYIIQCRLPIQSKALSLSHYAG